MANEKEPKSQDTVTINLHNPTQARRVIYDGISVEGLQGQGSIQKSITVDAGATKENVTIHRSIVEELRQRNRDKRDSDLVVMPLTSKSKTEESAAA